MVDLLFVGICFGIAFADALGHHASIALGVAGVLAVIALHAGRVFEKISAQRTAHDVVELALHKLVAVHFVDFLLALTNSALAAKTGFQGSAFPRVLHEVEAELDLSSRLKVEPTVYRLRYDGGLSGGLLGRIHGALVL